MPSAEFRIPNHVRNPNSRNGSEHTLDTSPRRIASGRPRSTLGFDSAFAHRFSAFDRTWHGPTPDEGIFEQFVAGEAEIIVEHFEIDGDASLKLDLEAVLESD